MEILKILKKIQFLKKYNGTFTPSGKAYGEYHLDYQEQDEVHDIYPGDYIVDKKGKSRGINVSIYIQTSL